MTTITLSRAEAVALDAEMYRTGVAASIDGDDTVSAEETRELIRYMLLEATIRDDAGWWGADHAPGVLDVFAKLGQGECPESFTLSSVGVAALIELLPAAIDRASPGNFAVLDDDDRERLRSLTGLAVRLDVELGDGVTALSLTRGEASAIAYELLWTTDPLFIVEHLQDCDLATTTPAGNRAAIADLEGAIECLRLEATIRDCGGWWGDDDPHRLDMRAQRHDDAQCPDTFTLDSDGAAALRAFCGEHLPRAVAEHDELLATLAVELDRPDIERRRAGLVSLAGRLGVTTRPLEAA